MKHLLFLSITLFGFIVATFAQSSWTWISGSDLINQNGIYGTKGIASSSNTPGARSGAASCKDSNNTLWLFGGYGFDATGNSAYLNDLWKFDGTNWAWISGSNSVDTSGTYGTQGIASSLNIPGARDNAVSWIDSSNNLWLFGGSGYDSVGTGSLNDLWKYNGINWTWISGSDIANQNGNYGTKGIASSSNIPGARFVATYWKDSNNNLWLFGGYGYDSIGFQGRLNDLWKFNGMNWTWISGSDSINQNGNYGTKGIASSSNIPGARSGAASWIDSSDTLWLFGGNGYDSTVSAGYLNDLWKFDGTSWVWISGSNSLLQSGIYGTQGIASSSNIPGARTNAVSLRDSNNNLWIFGGSGYDSTGTGGYLNDLWRFDGTSWTWISGSNLIDQSGIYGTKGIASSLNTPDGCSGAASWIDSSNNIWIFGGTRYGSVFFNSLWRFRVPVSTSGSLTSNSLSTSPVTSSPLTTSPVTSSPVTSRSLTTSPLTTSRLTTSPITSSRLTTNSFTSGRLTSSVMTTNRITSSPITTSPVTSSRLTTSPITSSPLTTNRITSAPITSSPITSAVLTTSPATSAQLTTSPITSAEITSSKLTTSSVTTSPLSTGEITSAPLTTSPITSSPLTTDIVTSAPITSSPITSAQLTTSPITSAEVTSNELTTSSITSSQLTTNSLQLVDNVGSGASITASTNAIILIIVGALVLNF